MTALPPNGPDRPTPARMARIHLRVGLVSLARAELETMAGRGELDGPSLADLAEARWRTGDLPGAGEAARAHLDGGGDEPIAQVVAAEAEAARGDLAEGRALARRLQGRADVGPEDLEQLLGGRARAPFWPQPAPPAAVALAEAVQAQTVGSADGVMPADATDRSEPGAGAGASQPPLAEPTPAEPTPAEPTPAEPVEVAEDPGVTAARLGLLLRERSLPAPAVLERAEATLAALPPEVREGPLGGALHLVRGDAYRQMGREDEAGEAYRACWTALANLPPSDIPEEAP